MYIIDLNYVAPLERIDALMGDHMKFLRKYYKLNVFVASGRKVPRTGGIILALPKSKTDIEGIIQEDPFIKHRLANFAITEFQTSQCHPELKGFLNRGA